MQAMWEGTDICDSIKLASPGVDALESGAIPRAGEYACEVVVTDTETDELDEIAQHDRYCAVQLVTIHTQ